jgi:nicotinate-nucleotide pyrophosphorylase (carboxylating)
MPADFHQLEWDAVVEDDLRQLIRLAVREDLAKQQDWTTVALVDATRQGRADVVARESGVISGLSILPVLVDEVQAAITFETLTNDGDEVVRGAVLAELRGSARDLLTCERPLLNFISRLSGIATLTRKFVQAVAGTKASVYDTRKTTPGWRRLEKYAVHCGGGRNHRTGLFDAMLIKDNHLAIAGDENLSPANAVRRARRFLDEAVAEGLVASMPIEIEVDSLHQLDEVLAAAPDIVLLDNMSPDELRIAVSRRNALAPGVLLEASGGVRLETVREIALTGVERISAGSVTHSAIALDVALDWHT